MYCMYNNCLMYAMRRNPDPKFFSDTKLRNYIDFTIYLIQPCWILINLMIMIFFMFGQKYGVT
jgi:hypothetical protein